LRDHTEENKKALAAISSLKRALRIANHPTKRDEFGIDDYHNNRCYIRLPDADSAELMGELLHRISIMPRTGIISENGKAWRKTIKMQPLEEGGVEVSIRVFHPDKFTARIQKVIEQHISPDKSGGRSR